MSLAIIDITFLSDDVIQNGHEDPAIRRSTSGISLQIIDNKLHKTHLVCVPGYMCTSCTRSKIFIGMTDQDNSYTDIYMMPCNILISTLLFIAKISPE